MFRKVVLLFCGLFIVEGAKAQYDSYGEEISRFHPGTMWWFTGLRPADSAKMRKYDRLMFDFTYNTWEGDVEPFENNWNSLGFNTNLLFDIPLVPGNTLALGTGLCHSITTVRHNNYLVVDSTSTLTDYGKALGTIPFNSSSLIGNSLSIPLELRIRSKGWRHVKLHVGGKIGYQLNLYNKTVFILKDGKVVERNHNYPDVERFIYSVHARIGIRNLAFFGSYGLNPIFKNSKSTKLYNLQFGITLSLF